MRLPLFPAVAYLPADPLAERTESHPMIDGYLEAPSRVQIRSTYKVAVQPNSCMTWR